MDAGTIKRGDLNRIFGRVVAHPDIKSGRPLLSSHLVEVLEVLEMMRRGLSDQEICTRHEELKQVDLDACRAYQARFLVDGLETALDLKNQKNVFMLDENTSYLVLPDVVKLFGRSTHVYAEGLYDENNDDEEDIWAYMIEHKFAAILTSDADFKQIARNYRGRMIDIYGSLDKCPEHIPAVIYVGKNNSRRELLDLLHANQSGIKDFIKSNHKPYATLNREGLKTHEDPKPKRNQAAGASVALLQPA